MRASPCFDVDSLFPHILCDCGIQQKYCFPSFLPVSLGKLCSAGTAQMSSSYLLLLLPSLSSSSSFSLLGSLALPVPLSPLWLLLPSALSPAPLVPPLLCCLFFGDILDPSCRWWLASTRRLLSPGLLLHCLPVSA